MILSVKIHEIYVVERGTIFLLGTTFISIMRADILNHECRYMLKFTSQLTLRCEDRYIQKGRNHHVTALIGLKSIQMSIIFLTVRSFFHSFCATDLNFGTKNNGRMKESTLKTLIFENF